MAILEKVEFNKLMNDKITNEHTLVIEYYNLSNKRFLKRFKQNDNLFIEILNVSLKHVLVLIKNGK